MAPRVVHGEEIINYDQFPDVVFPIEIHFSDGSHEAYDCPEDLELNLEFFDPDVELGCEVRDAKGQSVRLKVHKLQIEELKITPSLTDE